MRHAANLHSRTELSEIKSHLIYTLLYFDFFNYPLNFSELFAFNGLKQVAVADIHLNLRELCSEGLIYCENGYYFIYTTKNELVERREKGFLHAQFMMQKAYRFSRLISWFPFVKCICISGTLSKALMDEQSDIDYFIITTPGRLWIARTLLIVYKKVFLLNNRKYFCLNYFLDTNNLMIPDQNIFTATELLTLVPMYQGEVFKKLIDVNKWAKELLPNQEPIDYGFAAPARKNYFKWLFEFLFGGKFGDFLDTYFMKLTMKRWERKFGNFPQDIFDHSFRSRRYVSKHHPRNFQQRVLNGLNDNIEFFESTYQVHLNLSHG